MCSRPIKINDQMLACRSCNDCINTRKNEWVARAMAEKATARETFSITLTYGSDTQAKRDGAQVFRYADIKRLMVSLRRQIKYHYGVTDALRFICAGELGSDKGRVHWHLVLFSKVDLLSLGKWSFFSNGRPVYDNARKMTVGKHKVRLNWSLWKHGLVTVQEPDQWGIEYALAYAIKDQFNLKQSAGTMRQGKAQNFAAGYFRMSKNPPIGFEWVEAKLARLRARRSVLTSLDLYIEGYSGYYRPSRWMKDYILDALREINIQCNLDKGKDAPQWRSLLASVCENQNDWERLVYGAQGQEDELEENDFRRAVSLRGREIAQASAIRATRARCGSFTPCAPCLRGLTDEDFQAAVASYAASAALHGSIEAVEKHHKTTGLPSPFCLQRNSAGSALSFPNVTRNPEF